MNRRVGARYWAMAATGSTVLFELGELANLTVMGSVAASGMVPFSCLIARSASTRWSKRMKPTPLEMPVVGETESWRLFENKEFESCMVVFNMLDSINLLHDFYSFYLFIVLFIIRLQHCSAYYHRRQNVLAFFLVHLTELHTEDKIIVCKGNSIH